jgi:hypothetical protein
MTGLRDFLVDDAVEFLFNEEMIVPVKDGADTRFDKKLMNRHFPAGTMLVKAIASIGAFASPLHVGCGRHTAAHILAKSADEMMNEDKTQRRFAARQAPVSRRLFSSHCYN